MKNVFLTSAAACLLGLLFGGCLLVGGCGERSKPLRIGVNPWPGYELLVLSAHRGDMAAEGVDVEIVEYAALADVRIAFEQGRIDGMASTLAEVVLARDFSRRAPRVILVTDYSHGADMVLARPEIETIADLAGRRVGIEPETVNRFVLARALAKRGMTLSDVELRSVYQLDMPEAFRRGEVDAVVTYPPASVEIARQEHRVLFTTAEVPGEVPDVLSLDASVLAARPEDAAALLRAWERTLIWSREHPSEALAAMAKRERISEEEFSAAMEGLTLQTLDDQEALLHPEGPVAKAFELTIEVLSDTDAIDCQPRLDDLFDLGPLRLALAGLGERP